MRRRLAAAVLRTRGRDEEGLYFREQGCGCPAPRDACEGSVYYGAERCAPNPDPNP